MKKRIPFGEWLPDQPPLGNPGATIAKNVLPAVSSYIPIKSPESFSAALAAACLGATAAADKNGNVYLYAGTTTKLYVLNNASWTDVTRSSGGNYTLGAGEFWKFAKWDQKIIATSFADAPQVITMAGSNFAALGGSPPKAKHIAICRDFVVLGNCDQGGTNIPERVHWSGINDETQWASDATAQSDFNDIPGAGGAVQSIFSGEFGVVFQERAVHRMSYVGSPVVWQFDEVLPDIGLLAPRGAAQHGSIGFFLAQDGFRMIMNGAETKNIGHEKVNRTMFNELDASAIEHVTCVVDPVNTFVAWALPVAGHGGIANKIYIYNWTLDKWAFAEHDLQLIFQGATVGYTLDGLDSFSTDIDALSHSLDSRAWQGGVLQFGCFTSNNKMCLLSGSDMEATLETGEFELHPARKTMLTRVRPMVDSSSSTVAIGRRNDQSNAFSFDAGSYTPGASGRVLVRKTGYSHRVRVVTGGDFDHALGVEVEGFPQGVR